MDHLGRYVPGNSAVHRLDPRVKICAAAAFSLVALRSGFPGEALLGGFLAAAALFSRISFFRLLRTLRPAAFFFALLFCLHLFFTEGRPVPPFPLGPVRVTYEGFRQGALLTGQFVLLVLAASLLGMTTSPADLAGGLEKLLSPLRRLGVPVHDLALMVSLALRFVPTLLEEAQKIKEAQLARGADWQTGGLARKTKAAAALALPLASGALRRAEELAAALEARGYAGGPRTGLKELRLARPDYAALAVTALFLAGVYVLERLFFSKVSPHPLP